MPATTIGRTGRPSCYIIEVLFPRLINLIELHRIGRCELIQEIAARILKRTRPRKIPRPLPPRLKRAIASSYIDATRDYFSTTLPRFDIPSRYFSHLHNFLLCAMCAYSDCNCFYTCFLLSRKDYDSDRTPRGLLPLISRLLKSVYAKKEITANRYKRDHFSFH